LRDFLLHASAILALTASGLPAAAAEPDFYAGRHIQLLIGFSSGGGYDAYARLLARHLADIFQAIRRSFRRTCRAPAACAP